MRVESQAHPGDFVFGPRDVPHRYSVGDTGGRLLFIMTPGGFENLVREMGVPAASRSLPEFSEDDFRLGADRRDRPRPRCELLA